MVVTEFLLMPGVNRLIPVCMPSQVWYRYGQHFSFTFNSCRSSYTIAFFIMSPQKAPACNENSKEQKTRQLQVHEEQMAGIIADGSNREDVQDSAKSPRALDFSYTLGPTF